MDTVSSPRMRLSARIIFAGGLFFMVGGAVFLLASLATTSKLLILASFVLIIIGILLSFWALRLHKRSTYFFFSSFFILFGLFFFFSTSGIIPVTFREGWPALSIFAGLSLFPAGWHRYHRIRLNYLVSALFFVALGIFLLFFSLDVMTISFKTFILNWWPLVLVTLGLMLVLTALTSRRE